MSKTKCCNCYKEIGMASFKFSYSELWDVSSHPKVATMNPDDRLCSNCKKLFEDEINQNKLEEVQTRKEIMPEKSTKTINFRESLNFCPKCGKEIIENASYCVGCGLDITNFKNNNTELEKSLPKETLPKQEIIMTKSKSWSSKFGLIIGVFVIIGGAYLSNSFNVIIGIIMVVTSFVSLKNKSKTVDQFLTIVNLILFAVVMINLLNSF